ncbi:hypothetical protein, partial [Limnohabitans sp.]|uniref:hypothetical protein n=1 Tax=Limnohabitans sp. TaxID=1907725 RepID=UPI00333FE3B6
MVHEGQACQAGSLEFPFTARLPFKKGCATLISTFDIGLFIAMQMADGVGNWLVQSVAYEDIDYICVKVVGPKDKFKVLAGQVSQSLFKALDVKHAQAAANNTVDSDDEYFNMIRESLLTPQQERAPSAAKGRKKAHSSKDEPQLQVARDADGSDSSIDSDEPFGQLRRTRAFTMAQRAVVRMAKAQALHEQNVHQAEGSASSTSMSSSATPTPTAHVGQDAAKQMVTTEVSPKTGFTRVLVNAKLAGRITSWVNQRTGVLNVSAGCSNHASCSIFVCFLFAGACVPPEPYTVSWLAVGASLY